MMISYIVYTILFLNFLLEPIFNHFELLRVKKEPNRRLKYYYMSVIGLCVPIFLILLLVLIREITLSDLGLKPIHIGKDLFNIWFSYVILLVSALYMICIIYHIICMKISVQYRKAYYAKVRQSNSSEAVLDILLPVTSKEKKLWGFVSLVAGVCEEILFRGFLLHFVSELFPNLSIIIVIIIISFVFGLWHTYQGLKGMFMTFLISIFFSLFYISIGSIIPVIILHVIMDLSAKDAGTAEDFL
ncbi:CPBP family intramembrane metalloprotease [Lachnospiraceae bacterium MD1]|uniref:CPBP family intramembrane metalloprotease n=1 Tax=Variimorphobacter saccharofermentans TaxID=2755051 RepID=A0A839JY72_9FIRM|nr:CPBP family intramembrane glutamic endopeptidase [Variimorphobacter saccharofermentans]MBB2182178.1 CPBP family intramembrane metalloprotease [Variimorphobacter saccharofermentans]